MSIALTVNGSDAPNAGYITWTPVPLTITNNSGTPDRGVKLSSRSAQGSITKLWFMEQRGDAPAEEIEVDVPGTEKTVFVAGIFQPGQRHFGASRDGKDVTIEASFLDGVGVEGQLDVMVRVRRNANELSDKARDDFLTALAKLNGIKVDADPAPGPGKGIYVTDFVEMHVAGASGTEHGDSHFLPWHRLYVLDLERLLQEVNPAVTLPYWRFDQPAPNVFHEDFMGAMRQIPRDMSDPGGEFDQGGALTPPAAFAVDNPLSKWQIKSIQGIPRAARFDPANDPANGVADSSQPFDFPLRSQRETLGLADGTPGNPDELGVGGVGFSRMEASPHGAAHVSFNGYVNDVPVAPQDPLFFLLHSNVDRLWALWQAAFGRDASNEQTTYPFQSAADTPDAWKVVSADQWPWEDGTSQPGGLLPPGTRKENFTDSPVAGNSPGDVPKIEDAIDPYANRDPANDLGFAYDDVPYRHPPAPPVI